MRHLVLAALIACAGTPLVAADGVSGTWIAGSGPAMKVYIFKAQGAGFIGAVCGPCDDPSAVFRIADGTIADGGHVAFSIVRDDAGSRERVTATLSTPASGPRQIVATAKAEALPGGRISPAPVEGRWVVAGRVAQQNVTLKLRNGNKVWGVICGPCSNPDGVFLIEDGALDGDDISFFIHHIDTPAVAVRQNGPGRNFMKGTIVSNVMKFKWVREGRESEPGGEMTLIGPIR